MNSAFSRGGVICCVAQYATYGFGDLLHHKKCYNQIRFYDGSGKFLGFHTKTLLCGSFSDPPQGEINDYATRPLQTFEIKGIRVGGLICNDMWGNQLALPRSEHANASRSRSRLGRQCRQFYSFPHTVPCSAPSGVLKPDGQWAKQAPRQGEHVTVHTIELARKR